MTEEGDGYWQDRATRADGLLEKALAEAASLRSRLSAVEKERDEYVKMLQSDRQAWADEANRLTAERDLFKSHCEAMASALERAWLYEPTRRLPYDVYQQGKDALASYRKDSTP